MKEEILAAVMFLVRFIEKSETFPRDQLENFKNNLTTLLTQRFEKHWFPDVPAKGQGYRCIRVNGVNPVDMTLEKAALLCGLRYRDLRLPTELTVWVDPSEVCYRLGESEGSYCTLATFGAPSDAAHYKKLLGRTAGAFMKQQLRAGSGALVAAARVRQMAAASQWRCDRQAGHVPGGPPGAGYGFSPYPRHHHRNYKNVVTV